MTNKDHVAAICVADLHLTLQAPACRAEEDWLAVQKGYLEQLSKIQQECGSDFPEYGQVPILVAGDVFDRWNPPHELINFALRHLPNGILAVPGQHDLPNHRLEDMHKSGYGVLVQAGKIKDLSGLLPTQYAWKIMVYGCGWGQKIRPPQPSPRHRMLTVALIHRYCWTPDTGYPGAPEEGACSSFARELKGYDVAVFGDNHKGFQKTLKTGTVVFNCGTFLRRKQDERATVPRVGLLYHSGKVKARPLSTEKDRFHEAVKDIEEAPVDMQAFLRQLKDLGDSFVDFRNAVKEHLRSGDLSPEVQEIIRDAIE